MSPKVGKNSQGKDDKIHSENQTTTQSQHALGDHVLVHLVVDRCRLEMGDGVSVHPHFDITFDTTFKTQWPLELYNSFIDCIFIYLAGKVSAGRSMKRQM